MRTRPFQNRLVCFMATACLLAAIGSICGCFSEADDSRSQLARVGGTFEYDDRDPLGGGYRLSFRYTLVTDRDLEGPYLLLFPAHEVIELDLSITKVTDAGLEQLAKFPNLRKLNLASTLVSDTGMRHLTALKSLRSLDLSGTRVTGAGLNHLESLPELKTLRLRCTKLTDNGLRYVRELRQIDSLDISCTAVSDHGLENIVPLTQLHHLFVGPMVTDVGLEHILPLTRLETLSLRDSAISDAGVAQFQSLKELKVLNLGYTAITRRAITKLSQEIPGLDIRCEEGWNDFDQCTITGEHVVEEIEKLGGLVTSNTAVSGERAFSVRLVGRASEIAVLLPAISRIGRITELTLFAKGPASNIDLDHLAVLKDLRRLSVKAHGADLAPLSQLSNLQSLDLTNTYTTDEALHSISELISLRELSLWETYVTGESLKTLCRLSDLRSLNLSSTAITDDDIPHLQAFPYLESLNLSGTLVTDAGIAQLPPERLRLLNLRFTAVSDLSIKHISRMKSLKQVDLDYTFVTEEGVASLREALPHTEIRTFAIGDRAPRRTQSNPFLRD